MLLKNFYCCRSKMYTDNPENLMLLKNFYCCRYRDQVQGFDI